MSRTAVDDGTTVDDIVGSVPNDAENDDEGKSNVIVVSNVIDRPTDYLIVFCDTNPKMSYIENIVFMPLFRDYPLASFCLGGKDEEIAFVQNSSIWTPAFPANRLVIPYCLEGKGPTHPFPTFEIRESEMKEGTELEDNTNKVFERIEAEYKIEVTFWALRQCVGMPTLYSFPLEEELEKLEKMTESNLGPNTIRSIKGFSQLIFDKISQFEPINFQPLYKTKSPLSSEHSGYRTVGFMNKRMKE